MSEGERVGTNLILTANVAELNKMAANVAIGRNLGGVHYRSDGEQSMLMGEQVAISILRDIRVNLISSGFFLVLFLITSTRRVRTRRFPGFGSSSSTEQPTLSIENKRGSCLLHIFFSVSIGL